MATITVERGYWPTNFWPANYWPTNYWYTLTEAVTDAAQRFCLAANFAVTTALTVAFELSSAMTGVFGVTEAFAAEWEEC